MRHRQSILIVDDYDQIRNLLRRILQGAGYEVFEASNGRQAIKWLGENAADLVITDLIMPEQEGLETIQFLRSERPNLKIVAMSCTAEGQYLPVAVGETTQTLARSKSTGSRPKASWLKKWPSSYSLTWPLIPKPDLAGNFREEFRKILFQRRIQDSVCGKIRPSAESRRPLPLGPWELRES